MGLKLSDMLTDDAIAQVLTGSVGILAHLSENGSAKDKRVVIDLIADAMSEIVDRLGLTIPDQ